MGCPGMWLTLDRTGTPGQLPGLLPGHSAEGREDVLLEELQHRVANSLQIIASIILLKAKSVQSEETRVHLHDAHKRIMSVAAVQEQLHASGLGGSIEMVPYLTRLCETLATSMIGDKRRVSIEMVGEGG